MNEATATDRSGRLEFAAGSGEEEIRVGVGALGVLDPVLPGKVQPLDEAGKAIEVFTGEE